MAAINDTIASSATAATVAPATVKPASVAPPAAPVTGVVSSPAPGDSPSNTSVAQTQALAKSSLQISAALGTAWQATLTSATSVSLIAASPPAPPASTPATLPSAASAPAATSALTLRFMRSQVQLGDAPGPLNPSSFGTLQMNSVFPAQPVPSTESSSLGNPPPAATPTFTLSNPLGTVEVRAQLGVDPASLTGPAGKMDLNAPAPTTAEALSSLNQALRQAMPSFQSLLPALAPTAQSPLDPLVNLPASQQDNLPAAWKALLPGGSPLDPLSRAVSSTEAGPPPRPTGPISRTPINTPASPLGLPDTRFPGDAPTARRPAPGEIDPRDRSARPPPNGPARSPDGPDQQPTPPAARSGDRSVPAGRLQSKSVRPRTHAASEPANPERFAQCHRPSGQPWLADGPAATD